MALALALGSSIAEVDLDGATAAGPGVSVTFGKPAAEVLGDGVVSTFGKPAAEVFGDGVVSTFGKPAAEVLGDGVVSTFGKLVAEARGAGVTDSLGKLVAEAFTAGSATGKGACGELGTVNSSSKGRVREEDFANGTTVAGLGSVSDLATGFAAGARGLAGGGGGGGGGGADGRRRLISRAITETSRAGFQPVIPSFQT